MRLPTLFAPSRPAGVVRGRWHASARAMALLAVQSALVGHAATGWAQTSRLAEPGASTNPVPKTAVAKPYWRDLTAKQQRILAPLAPHWDALSDQHKRKWLAISRSYADLSAAEQEVMQRRMTDWAALSRQERVQARHNFAEVKQLTVDERKAKWEAYQALSDEEKRKLAARAATRQPGATVAIQPVPADRLAPLPAVAPDAQHMPRIQLAPPGGTTPVKAGPQSAPASSPVFPPVSAEAQVPAPSPESAPPAGQSVRNVEPSGGTP